MKIKPETRIREFFSEFPEANDKEAIDKLNMPPATYYRAKKRMKEQMEEVQDEVTFMLPTGVKQRILPPKAYPYTHLAAYLCKYRMGDKVPPYGKTKAEILYAIKKRVEDDPGMQAELVFGLQERLALYSIYMGDVSAFASAIGKLEIPENF